MKKRTLIILLFSYFSGISLIVWLFFRMLCVISTPLSLLNFLYTGGSMALLALSLLLFGTICSILRYQKRKVPGKKKALILIVIVTAISFIYGLGQFHLYKNLPIERDQKIDTSGSYLQLESYYDIFKNGEYTTDEYAFQDKHCLAVEKETIIDFGAEQRAYFEMKILKSKNAFLSKRLFLNHKNRIISFESGHFYWDGERYEYQWIDDTTIFLEYPRGVDYIKYQDDVFLSLHLTRDGDEGDAMPKKDILAICEAQFEVLQKENFNAQSK